MTCPICCSTDIQGYPKQRGLYPLGIVAIIGLPFALLHQASAPQRYHCSSCGQDFPHRTPVARIARVFLIIFGVALALLVLLAIITATLSQSS